MSTPTPRLQATATRMVAAVRRFPRVQHVLLHPALARPGYWFATACAFTWGALLFGRFTRSGGVVVARRLPNWAFGRGGTTIGAVYLTCDSVSAPILEHEAVHRSQWRRYGLAFIPLYVAAGQDARRNRFEVEADLQKGGYR